MRVAFAYLADYALAHPDGKVYVVGGGLDTIFAVQLPVQVPQLSLVVKIEFAPTECNRQHAVEVHGLDVDGNAFIPVVNLFAMPLRNPSAPTLPSGVQFVLNTPLLLTRAGEYAFSLVVDGAELASIPLRVALVQMQPQLPGIGSGGTPAPPAAP
jgi:hypothetical protein